MNTDPRPPARESAVPFTAISWASETRDHFEAFVGDLSSPDRTGGDFADVQAARRAMRVLSRNRREVRAGSVEEIDATITMLVRFRSHMRERSGRLTAHTYASLVRVATALREAHPDPDDAPRFTSASKFDGDASGATP